MEIKFDKNNTPFIEVKRDIVDLNKTFDCGQCFRWNLLGSSQTKDYAVYDGVVAGEYFKVVQMDHRETLNSELTTRIYVDGDKHHANKFFKYLDLNTDYSKLNIPTNDKFGLKVYEAGKGIRILKQEPWEATITFIISQRNNMPKIKSTVDKLCKACGTKHIIRKSNKEVVYYSFPTAEQLSRFGVMGLKSVGLGYRAEYIYDLAVLFENKTELEFQNFITNHGKNNSEAIYNNLLSIRGIGPKVANCISLFGFHCLDRFPIDVWIERVIQEEYQGQLDPVRYYGELAGLMQQYMFYYKTKYNIK